METFVTYCQRTGRCVRKFLNRLMARLSQKGRLKLTVAFSIPFLVKFEVSYEASIEKAKDSAAAEPVQADLFGLFPSESAIRPDAAVSSRRPIGRCSTPRRLASPERLSAASNAAVETTRKATVAHAPPKGA